MTVETATHLDDLDITLPLAGDNISEGDNHLRLIKSVLKTVFPGSGGSGFSTPITALEADINLLAGLAAGGLTNTELSYINTLTSNAQTQLDAKQPLDADLTAIAALATAAYGRSLLETASEAAFKALVNLEIGTDVQAYDADLSAIAALATNAYGRSLLTVASEAAFKALVNLEIGTDVQAYDADLAAIAALTTQTFGRSLLTQATASAARSTLGIDGTSGNIASGDIANDAIDAAHISFTNTTTGTLTVPFNGSVTVPEGFYVVLAPDSAGSNWSSIDLVVTSHQSGTPTFVVGNFGTASSSTKGFSGIYSDGSNVTITDTSSAGPKTIYYRRLNT